MGKSSTKGKDGAEGGDELRSSNTLVKPRICFSSHQTPVSSTNESLPSDISSSSQSPSEPATASTDTAIKSSESFPGGMNTAPNSDSFVNAQSSSRGQTSNISRRRASSAISRRKEDASDHGSITARSDNPEALKSEIRHLQAALVNRFSGGNRLVGGAQFKASCQKRRDSCVGCQQIKEVLRSSKFEACDLRGSLLRAELVINQLMRAKKRTKNSRRGTRGYILEVKKSGGSEVQEKMFERGRELERELRLADCRNSRDTKVWG